MKIGIDARFLTHPQPGGFKTYTENLVAALANLDQENEYFLYVDRDPTTNDLIPAKRNFQTRIVAGSIPAIGYPWREQIGLSRQAAKDWVDVFHSPCLTAPLRLTCPLVITIHDMIWAYPEKFSRSSSQSIKRRLMERYNYWIPKFAIGRASAIITVSNAARESIEEYLKPNHRNLFVTYEAPNRIFRPVKDEECLAAVRRKYNLPSKFILAIGSADPRKNISCLLEAYSLLPSELQRQYQLAIVWTHMFLAQELSAQVEKLQLRDNVQFLQHVSNTDLAALYNIASLFAFPSLYEGFGLPLLEAMACGAPVIAANTSSIPEIVADAAILFEARDPQELSKTMTRVLCNDELRAIMIQKGFMRNTIFAWEKCARETLTVYREILI